MKRPIALIFFTSGIIVVISTMIISFFFGSNIEPILKSLIAVCGVCFVLYKLLTGWLFINLTVQVEPSRQSFDNTIDNLSLKVMMAKGSIDSVWVKDIEIRISEIFFSEGGSSTNVIQIIKPIGLKKTEPKVLSTTEIDYWNGPIKEFYVISPNEEACFSAYCTVRSDITVSAEILVIGTRPFYGIESTKYKPILWKTSIIIFPNKKQQNGGCLKG